MSHLWRNLFLALHYYNFSKKIFEGAACVLKIALILLPRENSQLGFYTNGTLAEYKLITQIVTNTASSKRFFN